MCEHHAANERRAATCAVEEPEIARRSFLAAAASSAAMLPALAWSEVAAADTSAPVNLATVATPRALYVSGDTTLAALNSNADPKNSADNAAGAFGTWPRTEQQWIEYQWDRPVSTDTVAVYWWADGAGIAAPSRAQVSWWNGKAFVPVSKPELGVAGDRYNTITFAPVRTTRMRIEATGDGVKSIGILQWKVMSAGPAPAFAPRVQAGIDRTLVVGGQTFLAGKADWLQRRAGDTLAWSKVSGPGDVRFLDASAPATKARATQPGRYELALTATSGKQASRATLRLDVVAPPPRQRLDVVYTRPYRVTSPLWRARTKALIVNWIPHCIAYCERTDLKVGQGGLDNFIEAGKALRGEPHAAHKGYVFANAWVHQTVESMCIALMVDPDGDREIIAAQGQMRATLERWIPIILAAQESDGYLQTAYTLAPRSDWPERWSPEHRGDHEGYVAGYFIESAINHYELTRGRDRRLYDAAKKLADCWVAHIGPGKKAWFDGHQEMEQALVRFGRFVNDTEGGGRGDAYVALARFLLESRRGGSEYDQSHLPTVQQYEAVGHAVRAVYFYSGMADIAAETGDRDYQSAVASLWDNMVNRKYYVTGGVGSGDTAEGFGKDYALRNDSYCESCSSCGLIFFQYKMNLAYHDAKYADLYEETMYNALLGATDLAGKSFTYTNPLIDTERAKWHVCPCCVGNIPRTLLMLPTWTYAKDAGGLNVNLFVGSEVNVGEVAGTDVTVIQETDYPWAGAVALTVNPARPTRFALRVRVPNRRTSALYHAEPAIAGLRAIMVNGAAITPTIANGYAVIERMWKAGDRVCFEVPLAPQRVTADSVVEATRGRVALRYGPLVYNVERADGQDIEQPLAPGPIAAAWDAGLLGGVVKLTGRWRDGSPMVAIPNFARMNRTGRPPRELPGNEGGVDYAPGSAADGGQPAATPAEPRLPSGQSLVWMRSA